MTWFIAVAICLTVVGTFFRGPDGLGSGRGELMPAEDMGKLTARA